MRNILRRIAGWLALSVALCASVVAANWSEPARSLAATISGMTGPGVIALEVRNSSSIANDQVTEIRRSLESELAASGVRVDVRNVAAEVRVTLSENIQGYIWIAEVKQGPETRVAMIPVVRLVPPSATRQAALVSIRKILLHIDESPILDALVLGAGTPGAQLVLLQPDSVSLLGRAGDRWALQHALPIAHARPWPRDLRGRLAPARDYPFDAYLPGMICSASPTVPISLRCREGDDPWPLGAGQKAFFGAARNFYNGVLVPGIAGLSNLDAFYSAAAVPRPTYTLWITTGVDGKVRLIDGINSVVSTSRATREWGSDIAAVASSCGGNTQILAASAGDQPSADFVRAYEVIDRDIATASEPVDFNGPVTAMWTQADGVSAVAVAHNRSTGKYEAYSLAVVCGQ